jgi:hypothetical protein
MLSAACKTAIRELYLSGGGYSCDLVQVCLNNAEVIYNYYDLDYAENDLQLIEEEFSLLGDNDILTVNGMRALQGGRIMIEIRITKTDVIHHDFSTQITTKLS